MLYSQRKGSVQCHVAQLIVCGVRQNSQIGNLHAAQSVKYFLYVVVQSFVAGRHIYSTFHFCPLAMASLDSLLRRTSIEDHGQVLQSANAYLAKTKSDTYAQHVKAVALLKLDRYEDCLRIFEEGGDPLKQRASLEYAYALYKCGNLDDSVMVISKAGVGRGARHLEAQAVCLLYMCYKVYMCKYHCQ